MRDFVTIIVPVYNIEKYLKKCIESILNQSYTNFEIILINDGSTDKSLEICNSYAKIDNRIRVFSQTNKGVSTARNIGIENAKGDFITFVDSDDWIEKDMIETLLKCMHKNELDVCICNTSNSPYNDNSFKTMNGNEAIIGAVLDNTYYGYLWNKMYKKSLILDNNIFLNENIHVIEDLLFNYEIFKKTNKIGYIKKGLYHYEHREDSVTSHFSIKGLSALEALNYMIEDYEKDDKFKDNLIRWIYNSSMHFHNREILDDYWWEKTVYYKKKYFKYVLKSKYASAKEKIKDIIKYYYPKILTKTFRSKFIKKKITKVKGS